MYGPIATLIELNGITLRLNRTQAWIDKARSDHPTDQLFQLELDRKQIEVDEKRIFIEAIKLDISQYN